MAPMKMSLLASLAGVVTAQKPKDYDYYCVGKCDAKVQGNPTPGSVLMGGSTDVDEAFVWMNELSGGGDFVILRATGSDGYNDYIYEMGIPNPNP